jgi:rhodanese-related sulfurtransferase
METVIVDVREKDEFDAQHVPGSIWVPLSQFAHLAPGVLQALVGRKVVLMCRSGKRAALAERQIGALGFGGQLKTEVYPGGILEWARQGKPVAGGRSGHLPVLRQVQLAAGAMVLTSVVLSFKFDPRLAWLAAFVGGGLFLAGLTGFCPLAELLAKMPWNRSRPGLEKELCCASPRSKSC